MQDTCILGQKYFIAHGDVISDEYITDKVQNQEGGWKTTYDNRLLLPTRPLSQDPDKLPLTEG